MTMPDVPTFRSRGACEHNRLGCIKLLKDMGYEITVVSKIVRTPKEEQERFAREWGVTLIGVEYARRKSWLRYLNPMWWDGAAYEYADPAMQKALGEVLARVRPAYVWCDYTFTWPLFPLCRKFGAKVIVRSHNFEPTHFLSEEGIGGLNLVRFAAKILGEAWSAWRADIVCAVSPKEERWYRSLGARVVCLPNGSMPDFLAKGSTRTADAHEPVHLAFMGSSYNVPHNYKAAKLLIERIMPELENRAPGAFVLHLTGGKLPSRLAAGTNVQYEGYVEDLDAFLEKIDVALVPTLYGGGMQLKIFEPLARGIPTVAFTRSLGGYPFGEGEIAAAKTVEEFIDAIIALKDPQRRTTLSAGGYRRAQSLFSKEAMMARMKEICAA